MQISVDINNVSIKQKGQIESGEYNVTPCLFSFSEEYNELIKTAVFTKNKKSYKMNIINGECTIPYEVLEKEGATELGVYGYEETNNELVLRYSPKPCVFNVTKGSYTENSENSTPPTPTQFEQYEQELHEGLNDIQSKINEADGKIDEMDTALNSVNTAIQQTNNLDLDANKVDKTTTVQLTKKDGNVKSVQIADGISLQFMWQGTRLGIKTEEQENYTFVDLQGIQRTSRTKRRTIHNKENIF